MHAELLTASAQAAEGAPDEIEFLARAFDAFLDAVLERDVQQIIITDAPAVLGLARFTELDERDAFTAMTATLRAAVTAGTLQVEDPETLARLLLGALTRGGLLIANSPQPAQPRNTVARRCGSCSPDSQRRRTDVPTISGCDDQAWTAVREAAMGPRERRRRRDRVTKRDQDRLDRIRARRDLITRRS